MDYDPRAPESIEFFKIVQNKIHFAAHGHTAAEIIAQRADAELPFMGLTVFSGKQPIRREIGIAKNYLTEGELATLNRMVSAYFDLAELRVMAALEKARAEYDKYRKKIINQHSPVERRYLASIKDTQKKIKEQTQTERGRQ